MYICPNCKKQYDTRPKFCGNCGAKIDEPAQSAPTPVQVAPPQKTPLAVQAVPYAQSVGSTSAVPAVFILSICGFVTAVVGLILTALFFTFGLNKIYTWAQSGMIIGFCTFALSAILSIITVVSTGKDRKNGRANSTVNISHYLGVIAIVLSLIILSFSFANIYAYNEGPRAGEASGYFDRLLDDDDRDDDFDDEDFVIWPDRPDNSYGSFYGSTYRPPYDYPDGSYYDPYYYYGSYY